MNKTNALKDKLINMLEDLKRHNVKIAAYGASAKGTTLLNYFGIGRDFIDFVVDKSPAKQGKFTPGTQLPINAPNKLLEEKVSHALLLAWNFADEIIDQQKTFTAQGGKFIIPLPDVKII